MLAESFFRSPQDLVHRRYEALRAFYVDGLSASEISGCFGYTVSAVYSLARNFTKLLETKDPSSGFFVSVRAGRKPKDCTGAIEKLIIELRKKYLSVPDIKAILDSLQQEVSEKYIYNIVHKAGFARLPRRNNVARNETFATITVQASKSEMLGGAAETFQAEGCMGVLCLIPYLQKYRIATLIERSTYPETKSIPRLNAILSFLALKLSNVRRYTSDDLWCMDRGLGLFAGLNVLPKAAWFSSYSHRVTREMNREFLKSLVALWRKRGLLSDTANLDFSTIPYWGDDSHLENNWSGTRHKALASILAALSHDPDSGIITYGDTTIRHKNKADVAVEFIDFYKDGGEDLQYLVFDSKFTTYQNLRKLDDRGVKFLTIRARGEKIVSRLNSIPHSEKKKIRVPASHGKKRLLFAVDETVFLKEYGKEIRQVALSGHGRIKPAIIITNDFKLSLEDVVRKYARRWLVEKTISQQIEFFHFNRVSSSMVIKVDFDLTMSILAHNLYRLFAMDLEGYAHNTPMTLFNKFIHNGGDIRITQEQIVIDMKKKRHLPAILGTMETFKKIKIPWLQMKTLVFRGASRC
jgi:transposase